MDAGCESPTDGVLQQRPLKREVSDAITQCEREDAAATVNAIRQKTGGTCRDLCPVIREVKAEKNARDAATTKAGDAAAVADLFESVWHDALTAADAPAAELRAGRSRVDFDHRRLVDAVARLLEESAFHGGQNEADLAILSLTARDEAGHSDWVGFANYLRAIEDPNFQASLVNTVILLACMPIMVMLPMLLAILIHSGVPGGTFFRVVYFLPAVLSSVVIGAIFNVVLRYDGSLNAFLDALGINAVDWLGSSNTALGSLIAVQLWSTFGMSALIFMAALPIVLIYVIFQRRIVAGIAAGAVKG